MKWTGMEISDTKKPSSPDGRDISRPYNPKAKRRFVPTGATRLKIIVTIAALVVAAGLLANRAGQYDPFEGSAVVNPPFTSLTYGVQAFLWWDKNMASLALDWTRLMVFSDVKQMFSWKDLEPNKGEWDFTRADELVGEVEAKGLKLVVRLGDTPGWAYGEWEQDTLTPNPSPSGRGEQSPQKAFIDSPPSDFQDFADYCGAIAGRYKGRIAAYQIWNEPNLAREWGGRTPNAAEYVALLKACSEAIRTADPGAILISAGLAPTGTYTTEVQPDDMYFQAMYDAGFQQYIDVAGVNAPGYNFPPEVSPDDAVAQGSQRFFTFRRVEDMRKIMVKNGDAARQMAILEMGWTTDPIHKDYAWYAVTEEQKADYFVRAYAYAAEHWRPWMGLMTAIYIPDPAWTPQDEQYWWAITLGDNRIGKAFIDLANMAKYCGDRVIPARAPDSPEAKGLVTVSPCD
jgi:polysaccharide biosynthesis protein PslG